MPGKRTNDSVDEILHELGRQQTDENLRGQVVDRQVDDILRSVGVLEDHVPAAQLGPIDLGDLPDVAFGTGAPSGAGERFPTAVLDDLLGDLPSLQSAAPAPAAPARPARRPAPAPAPQKSTASTAPAQAPKAAAPARPPVPPAQPPKQETPAPAPADTVNSLGDTTRTGIIKNFLQKMGGAGADASALNEGKREFQRFFEESAAVVPDEKGHLHGKNQRKRKGLFGLRSVEETDEFVPINVSLTGHAEEPPAEELPAEEDTFQPEEETEPSRPPQKQGLFARLFGRREPAEELYIPESREPEEEKPRGGITFDTEDTGEVPYPEEEPAAEPTMQLPLGSIRSKYTAGRGAGLEQTLALTAEVPEPAAAPRETTGEVSLGAPSDDPFSGMLPGDSTLAFIEREISRAAQRTAQPPATGGSTVYRKRQKRTTVEFAPRQAGETPRPAPVPAPETPAYTGGPVGETVMTSSTELPPLEEPAPAKEEPAVHSGFTVEMDPGPQAEDTQMFLSAYDEARSRRSARRGTPARAQNAAPAPAPEEAPPAPTGEVGLQVPASGTAEPEAPASAPAEPDGTGVVSLGVGSVKVPVPKTSEFVRGIQQSIDASGTRPSISLGDTTGDLTAPHDDEYYRQAAELLTDTNSEIPEKARPRRGPRLSGVPEDEQEPAAQETATMPPFTAAPKPTRHAYDKPSDAPAVRRDLEKRAMVLAVSAIVTGVLALVLLYLGIAASGAAVMPAPLDLKAGKAPLLVVMLVLLVAACCISWRTMWEGVIGLVRSPSPDSMPALAALAAAVQLIVFLVNNDWYVPTQFWLVAGPAALLLCMNTVGKALDARTLSAGFALVSAKGVDHAVAYRLKDSALLRAATRGLGESRPCVLVSRPTELFKGYLNSANAHRTSDKNQQQFAWALGVCGLIGLIFTLVYHQNVGMAVSALATVLCLGAPLAGLLVSSLPMCLMQRSAAQVGAVVPGWRDIRQLGRINVIHLTTRDLFPAGCVELCGIKPVHKEQIDRAITYAASVLAGACPSLRDVFLGMIGDNRKLLAKVDDFQTVYGKGYIGWIDGERVLVGNRLLLEEYGVQLPSIEYEQRHTVNQRRVLYLAVSGSLYSMFQIAYRRDPDTAAVLDDLRRIGMSVIVDGDDFNCDEALLEAAYNLPAGVVKVLTAEERKTLEPATAWLPESEGNMLHLGSFASFVGGLEAAAGAAESEHRATLVLSAAVLLSCVLGVVLTVTGGIVALPLPAIVLYQVAWAVLALIFPVIQRY